MVRGDPAHVRRDSLARLTLQSRMMALPIDGPRSTWARRARIVLCVLVAPALLAVVGEGAFAQSTKAGATPPKGHAAARPAPPKKTPTATPDAGAAAPAAPALAAPTAAPAPAAPAAGDAGTGTGVVEAKTLDGGTKVYTFSELDIEGRLKSPQLVYFLRRVRAEFAAGDLGHRSFMREMSETRKESSF
jgi:hypothetical protein